MTAIETYLKKQAASDEVPAEVKDENVPSAWDRLVTNPKAIRNIGLGTAGTALTGALIHSGLRGGAAASAAPAAVAKKRPRGKLLGAAATLGGLGTLGAYGYSKMNPDIKGLRSPFRSPFEKSFSGKMKDPRVIAAIVAALAGGYGLYRMGANKSQQRMY